MSERAIRSTVNLMHIAAGRFDLSTDPCDHEPDCPRALDPGNACECWTPSVGGLGHGTAGQEQDLGGGAAASSKGEKA